MKSFNYPNYRYARDILLSAFLLFQISGALCQDDRALIKLDFIEEEEQKLVKASVYHLEEDSVGHPIEDLELYFFVQRTFSQLPIGGRFNTTDENGEVTIEFPPDLPGDTQGNLELIVKIVESDDYADTSVYAKLKWGIPLLLDESETKRTLWAAGANAPISLMIITNLLILVAWGIIIYISFKIYSISKM